MSERHDFYLANNAILLSFSWAWDKFEQPMRSSPPAAPLSRSPKRKPKTSVES